MARLAKLSIRNYRSIGDPVVINFPPGRVVTLVGENNAGKSNIVKAISLLLGPTWPSNYEPEDHEFFGRTRRNPIEIRAEFDREALFGGRFAEVVWRYNPFSEKEPVYYRGVTPHGEHTYIRSEDRDTCTAIVIDADRNLSYHLSYASRATFLSRLMHQFHKALLGEEQVKSRLEELFELVKGEFLKIPSFQGFLEELQSELAQMIGSMTHRLEVSFEAYNPVNFFHALRLQATEGGSPRTLDEMGTGERQVLAMAFAYAYARAFHGGILLVIEEPEAHLHPLAQEWLGRRLSAMARGGLQVLVTTHSPAFVNVLDLDGLVVVRKINGTTRIVQPGTPGLVSQCIASGGPAGRVTAENILPFYAANATREILEGFFSKLVVLVEGPTEKLALPVLLSKVGLEAEHEGIAFVSVGGKGNLAKWRRLFDTFGIPSYVVFDNDARDDSQGDKRKDALRAVGVDANAEKYIGTHEWIVEAEFAVFGSNYEQVLRRNFADYSALEEQAKREGIDSKPFIARWVAERLEPKSGCPGWEKVQELAEKLQSKIRQQ